MWDIKLKAIDDEENKQILIDTDNSLMVTREKGGKGEIDKGKRGQI